jgi:hypothetical protein
VVLPNIFHPGKKPSGPLFQPYQMDVAVWGLSGMNYDPTRTVTVTVVGLMTRATWQGIYVSARTALASGFFASVPEPGAPATPGVSITQPALSPTGYCFMLQPGADVNKARLDIGRMLVKYALEPVVSTDQAGLILSTSVTLVNLITGFLALGFIVGVAGLGVISTRAVVERLQQIGMLRALGYRRSLVRRSFLLESSLVAVLGLIIGSTIGVWQAYRFFMVDKVFGNNMRFHVPFVEIAGFLLLAYLATLLTTYLPARTASRVAPAEALRYE